LYLSCRFYVDKVTSPDSTTATSTTTTNTAANNSSTSNHIITNMILPTEVNLRKELMLEFQKIRKFQKIQFSMKKQSLSLSSPPSSMLYLLPANICHDSVHIDFISLCITPPVNNGGLRTVDYRLEPLLLPTNQIDNTSHILSTYETQSASEIHKFIDNILEEVDDKYANILKHYEHDVTIREGNMKSAREEVEKERKNQELHLKDLRQIAEGGGAMAHSSSNTNVTGNNYQQQQQQRSYNNSGSNNSRR